MITPIYEDNHILVVVKPPRIPVQADESGDMDLLTMLKADVKERYNKPGAVYLGLVHRLDRPVGGVMVFARTSKAAARLSAVIREGKMDKRYLCVAAGDCPGGELTDYLKKDARTHSSSVVKPGTEGAKLAKLAYEKLDYKDGFSLCDIELMTGRSHQIRVQFSSRGMPLVGERKYCTLEDPCEIALWSYRIAFTHPGTGKRVEFAKAPPQVYPWTEV